MPRSLCSLLVAAGLALGTGYSDRAVALDLGDFTKELEKAKQKVEEKKKLIDAGQVFL